jgi:hypothetical protein
MSWSRPIATDSKLSLAVYDYIEGEKIASAETTTSDVRAAIDFLGRLKELSRLPESQTLDPASEACFTVRGVVENIERRLQRLAACTGEAERGLQHFLSEEFSPALEQLVRWSQSKLQDGGTSFEDQLDVAERTLSPSDFGFHNALKQADGRMMFLDFEYFGWDDPAKMIVDFLLHPGMGLVPAMRSEFTTGVFRHFADSPGLVRRLQAVYPLFGLKWCLILLNEFLPDPLLRRRFAGAAELDRVALQNQQLEKAKLMLHRVTQEYERFLCHG